jgi:hypothetical protein
VIEGECSLSITDLWPNRVEVYETYKNQILFDTELTFDSRYGPQLDSISPQWVYLSDEPKYVKLLGSGFQPECSCLLGSSSNITTSKGMLMSDKELICPIEKFDFVTKEVKSYKDVVFTSRLVEGKALQIALKCVGYEVTSSIPLYLKPAFTIQEILIIDEDSQKIVISGKEIPKPIASS